MEPTTAITLVQMASSVSQMFGPTGGSVSSLLNLQAQQLRVISAQLSIIQQTLEIVIKRLDEIEKLLGKLPEAVVKELKKGELKSIIGSYAEVMDGYSIERERRGILKAREIYRSKIEESILKRLIATRSFLIENYEDPFLIPIVAMAIQTEIHATIMAAPPGSFSSISSALKRYEDWFTRVSSGTDTNAIPACLLARRTEHADVKAKLAQVRSHYLCASSYGRVRDLRHRTMTVGCVQFRYRSDAVTLTPDQQHQIAPLLEANIIKEDDLPRLTVPEIESEFEIQLALNAGARPNFVSSHPDIIPEGPGEFDHAFNRMSPCGGAPPVTQTLESERLTKLLNLASLSIIAYGALVLTANEALKSIATFRNDPDLPDLP